MKIKKAKSVQNSVEGYVCANKMLSYSSASCACSCGCLPQSGASANQSHGTSYNIYA